MFQSINEVKRSNGGVGGDDDDDEVAVTIPSEANQEFQEEVQ